MTKFNWTVWSPIQNGNTLDRIQTFAKQYKEKDNESSQDNGMSMQM